MSDKRTYYQSVGATQSTVTRDMSEMNAQVGNVYETVSIIARRANQISVELKKELDGKLQDYSLPQEGLEEMFENKEQIDISRSYEAMPKATLLATQEFVDGKLIIKNSSRDED